MDIKEIIKGITIREVKTGDEALINEFFDAMGGETRALFNRRDYNRKGVLKFCQKGDPTRHYYMAEFEGKMAGYVFFLDYNTSIPTMGLAIRDDLRGLHLGKELITYAQGRARTDGKGGLMLTTHVANIRAQSLYETMGFVNMGLCKNGSELFYLWRFID